MPEGDTIHKLARALRPAVAGKKVRTVWTRITGFSEALTQAQVLSVDAIGKHLLTRFEGDLTLRIHLGMKGIVHRYGRGEARRRPAHSKSVEMNFGEFQLTCFSASQVALRSEAETRRDLAHLGPDLISRPVDYRQIARRLEVEARRTPLEEILLRQNIAAGIGNVYKSELLFALGLPPKLPRGLVEPDAILSAYRLASMLLRRNVALPGRREVVPLRLRAAGSSARLFVYGRTGRACLLCGTAVVRAAAARDARGTYFCPQCQSGGSFREFVRLKDVERRLRACGLASLLSLENVADQTRPGTSPPAVPE